WRSSPSLRCAPARSRACAGWRRRCGRAFPAEPAVPGDYPARVVVGRFAPSPSGHMHLGNARTALLAWLDTRAREGRMLLRIEDLDRDRCRPQYVDAIRHDLRWLGLDWDVETTPQSRRDAAYGDAIARLERDGLIYEC